MLLVRKSSWNFVPSLTNLAWMGCCVLLRNGLCACSLLIWPSPFSILRLKSICLPFVHCTLNRFSDPLVDYLRSQRVLRGIKRSLGDAHSLRHPSVIQSQITLLIIFNSLNMSISDHQCSHQAAPLQDSRSFKTNDALR